MKLLIFVLASVFSGDFYHEFKLGRYEVKANEDDMTLFIQLDRHDFFQAVQARSGCNDDRILDICMTEYIVDHFKLKFDGEDACFEYRSHTIKEEFVEINFRIGIDPEGIQNIQVFNNMLLEQWDYQENIVYSLLNDARRSFRLNKNRLSTVISYD